MINSRRQLLKHLAQVYDLAAFVSSFLMTTFLLYSWSGGQTLPDFMMLRIKLGNCVLFALLILAWYNILVISKLYVSKRLTNLATEIYEVSKSALGACLFLYLSARILHIHLVNIRFATVVYIFCTTNMVLGRVLAKRLLARLRQRGRNTRFLLVVGTNERAIEFADAILERPELGYNIVGFVDEDWDGIAKFQTTGHSRCCAFDGLADFLR